MIPPNIVPAELLRASTLDEMLEAVPLLGEYDSLGAVPTLAAYDRRAKGWFAAVFSWLGVVLATAWAMSFVGVMLTVAGWGLSQALGPSADELISGLGGTPLQLTIGLVGLTLGGLAFNYAGPRRWLVGSTRTLRLQVRLRVLLLRAIRSQLARNRKVVENNWRRAVCQNCLARYELHRVRFAYWRWLSFARCRKCHGDHACYSRVRRIEGWLDEGMGESQEQTGDAVRVNLLYRLPPRSVPLPTDLDELVVADAEDEDVETLIFFYRSVQPRTNLPKPKRLRFRLTKDSNVSQMSWRQLNQNFWFISAALPRRK
jgi:hypothetical protein